MKRGNIKIPWFPIVVLLIYVAMMVLWRVEVIPPPETLIDSLEVLVEKIGVLGIFAAAFLEGLAFIGHQFPGMSLIVISLVITDGSFTMLMALVASITLALTASSLVNYYFGYLFSKRKNFQRDQEPSKTLFLSALHPNFLSLYFFHAGMNRKNMREILFVPIIIFPYGIIVSLIVFFSSDFIRNRLLKEEFFFLSVFAVWIIIEFFMKNRKKLKTDKNS